MNRIKVSTLLAVFVLALTGSYSAMAATLYWDGTPTTPDGASAGGGGTWDTTTANWDDGTSYVTWTNANNDTAVFGGTAGTVTLGEGIMVGGITLNTGNYLIRSNTLTLASGTIIYSTTTGTDNTTDPEISSALAGTNGFTKTGTGWLGLNATSNSLSGNINIQAGTLYTRHEALGSGDIVFTGNSSLVKVYGADKNFPATMDITVNPGITATISASTFYYDTYFPGILAGNSTSKLTLSMGSNSELQFRNNANTFEGELTISGPGINITGKAAEFNSLADSTNKIKVANGLFRLRNGGVSMNFTNRQFEMNNNVAGLENESTSSSVTMSFSQPLIATIGNTARTLTLAGVNTGANTISGAISNSANGSGAVSVSKQEAGKWILSGNNTYSGTTLVAAGTLVLSGSNTCTGVTTVYTNSLLVLEGEESIIDTGTVNINNGGKVEVTTKEKIAVLQYSGAAQASGTYGSLNSSAENKTDTYFAGPGVLYVGVNFPPAGTIFIIK